MNASYGDTGFELLAIRHRTAIEFHGDQMPLRWAHCSTTADFFSGFIGKVLAAESYAGNLKDVNYSIGYLANELLENSVKFRAGGSVKVMIGLSDAEVLFSIDNLILPEVSEKFQALLEEITSNDPGDLLIQKIEENAEGGSGSGLGILTLLNDYQAKLGWTFVSEAHAPEPRVRVLTTARLALS